MAGLEPKMKKESGVRRRLGEILLFQGVIDSRTLQNALEIQKVQDKLIGRVLIDMGVVDDVEIANALAAQKKVPFVRLRNKRIPEETIALIPASLARKNKIVPIKKIDNALYVALADPLAAGAVDDVKFFTQLSVRIVITPERDILEAVDKYYPDRDIKQDLGFGMEQSDLEVVKKEPDEESDYAELLNLAGLPPVVRFTNAILAEAIKQGASDVHIEPQKDLLVVRNRIDGILTENLRTDKHLHPSVVSRIKILSDLDISIRRKPQDGKAQVKYGGKPFDLRISTIPTSYGEKITIRILNPDSAQLLPEQLGFDHRDLTNLLDALNMPQGIVLVTGPTGSGKSSTLYACLKKLNKPEVNIVTVEDPVEFDVGGINQVQINPKAGITFAAGLRSILRQDPDIVMVGEIRDAETARIAFQAAQTGHLVLSTLHTNDAPSAVTRLLDLGIEPFLVSGSLLAVLGQRLVRRICSHCKVEDDPDPNMLRRVRHLIGDAKEAKFWKGAGCEACRGSGFSGRLGVFELLVATSELRKVIASNVSSQAFVEAADAEGFRKMTSDGVQKALDGLTTLGEVFRVAPPEVVSDPKETAPASSVSRDEPYEAKEKAVEATGFPPSRRIEGDVGSDEPPAFAEDPRAFVSEKPKILVADDNPVIREALKKILRKLDCEVLTATDGHAAFELAMESLPNLIITDFGMPVMNGFELIRKLKQHPASWQIPVLMLTARDEVESEIKAIEAGADDYLVKPVNAGRFLARVRRLLNRTNSCGL